MLKAKPADTDEEERSEEHDAEVPGASSHERKHGGRMERRRGGAMPHEMTSEEKKKHEERHRRRAGGRVPGKKAKEHPGRRARGGATADLNPMTAAGHMSEPAYEKPRPGPDEGGKGADSKGPHGRD